LLILPKQLFNQVHRIIITSIIISVIIISVLPMYTCMN